MRRRDQIICFYSKFSFLRYVPILGKFLENVKNMDSDPKARASIERLIEPFLSLKAIHRIAPKKYAGGIILNFLGLQVFRITFYHLFWKLRTSLISNLDSKNNQIVQEILKNGVVTLPDFYNASEISELVKDFNWKSSGFINHFPEFKEGLIFNTNAVKPWTTPLESEVAKKLFIKNVSLQRIINKVSGRNIRLDPEVTYLEYTCKINDLGKEQVDGQDRIHCDVAYPSFKVFIYVTDTDASNGAFIYAPGSHKFSFKRLLVEYKMSIKYYIKHFKGDIKPEMLSLEDMKLLNIKEKSMEGKSGSVIIFNTMGFHRRGDFTNSQKPIRQVVLVNYRYLDAWVNQLGWKA